MQQILQNLKTSSTEVMDVPCPYVAAGQLLIGTRVSEAVLKPRAR